MQTFTFPDNSRIGTGQILVTVYDDGTASIAFRDSVGDTWGPPTPNVVRSW